VSGDRHEELLARVRRVEDESAIGLIMSFGPAAGVGRRLLGESLRELVEEVSP